LESWRSTNANLAFEQYTGEGKVLYLFSGTVSWSDSGTTADNCVFTGSGSKSFANDDSLGGLTVDYRKGDYEANLQTTESGYYTIVETCPDGPPVNTPGPLNRLFWAPQGLAESVPLPFGSFSLPGSPASDPFTTMTWSLTVHHSA
jgi:hypothetical protein